MLDAGLFIATRNICMYCIVFSSDQCRVQYTTGLFLVNGNNKLCDDLCIQQITLLYGADVLAVIFCLHIARNVKGICSCRMIYGAGRARARRLVEMCRKCCKYRSTIKNGVITVGSLTLVCLKANKGENAANSNGFWEKCSSSTRKTDNKSLIHSSIEWL